MMTSQNNIQLIEKYFFGELNSADKFLFEARLILNPELRKEFYFQKKTYKLVKLFHREELKKELEQHYQELMSDQKNVKFQQTILGIFK